MALVDSIAIGQPILAQSHFGSGFYDDFSGGIDVNTSATPGQRDGKWKRGLYIDNITEFGAIWGSDSPYGMAAINNEEQAYQSPKYPHPSSWSGLSIVNGNLRITSEAIDTGDQAEVDWAKVKDFYLNPDGSNGAFVQDKPVRYKSEMISTMGRYSASFFRGMVRAKVPYGAIGSNADINQNRAVFPAADWYLRDVPYQRDQNGNTFGDGRTTYMPGNPNGDGFLEELDGHENFGESMTAIHQTTHLHVPYAESTPSTQETGGDILTEWVEAGVDCIPNPAGGGLIAFHINGVYTHIVQMPSIMRDPLPLFEISSSKPWSMVTVNGEIYEDLTPQQKLQYEEQLKTGAISQVINQVGTQQHADGSDRYMQFFKLCNLARDGRYPRQLARQIFQAGGTLPAHNETVFLEVEWTGMWPLIDDNPDTFASTVNGVPVATGGTANGNPTIPGGGITVNTGTYTGLQTHTYINRSPAAQYRRPQTMTCALPAGANPDDYTYAWSADNPNFVFVDGTDKYQVVGYLDGDSSTTTTVQISCDYNPI